MRIRNLLFSLVAFSTVLFFTQACTSQSGKKAANEESMDHSAMSSMSSHEEDYPKIDKAICVLQPTEGNTANGTVTFTRSGAAIKVVADVEGLTPGKHGFHIHQYGDISSPDGKSTGGHFNPEDRQHGAPHGEMRHVGDLGNIEADQDGKAHLELVDSLLTFTGPHSIIGRGIIVHAGEDDLESQPTGDAGSRVAAGVIGVAK